MSAALSVLLLSASCSSEFMPEDDAVNAENKLCFAVGGVQTRLVYDYEQTDFADGEAIGCVIANTNGGFLLNTKWTYRASDGMLILASDNDYIIKDPNKDPTNDSSYISFKNQNQSLKFFFYYPYIDATIQEKGYKNFINATTTTDKDKYKLLQFPNCATSLTSFPASETDYSGWSAITLTGEVASSSAATADAFAKYRWTEYPCFVNHTQGAVTGTTYDDKRLHNSDFLWAASPEISSTTNHTVNLTFQKKTATILVYSEVPLNDIYFVPDGAQKLIRGKKINLSTGELTDYTYNTAENTQEQNMYFNADEHIVPCYRGIDTEEGSTDGLHFYRLVLPAQTGCSFTMHVEADFNGDGNNQVAKEIKLSANDNLTELKEGCMYAIRISKSGKTTIRINDWKVPDNSGGTLEENK